MQQVFLSKIADPLGAIAALTHINAAKKKAAENDLRAYLQASLMLKTLEYAVYMYKALEAFNNKRTPYYSWIDQPYFWYPEESDSIDTLLEFRFKYVSNSAMGC